MLAPKYRYLSYPDQESDLLTSTLLERDLDRNKKITDEMSTTRGLFNVPAFTALIVWYITSFLTLLMNKYTLTTLGAEPVLFSTVQIFVSVVCGVINMYMPCHMGRATRECVIKPMRFYYNMTVVGATRFLVIYLGLVSLEHVSVSFTETVKSSAPLFTVLISFVILGERNGGYVLCSLIPIMLGLILCSAYEISFTLIGFLAAVGTNISECVQFVLSKLYVSGTGEAYKTTPAEFQFYTCLTSIFLQLPLCLYLVDYDLASQTDLHLYTWMVLNGIMYHLQAMTAWVLMEYISPVTHSVCNTVKRAIAIWLSVITFGNTVSLWSGVGTMTVIAGVLLYNKAREFEQRRLSGSTTHYIPVTRHV